MLIKKIKIKNLNSSETFHCCFLNCLCFHRFCTEPTLSSLFTVSWAGCCSMFAQYNTSMVHCPQELSSYGCLLSSPDLGWHQVLEWLAYCSCRVVWRCNLSKHQGFPLGEWKPGIKIAWNHDVLEWMGWCWSWSGLWYLSALSHVNTKTVKRRSLLSLTCW